MGLFNKPKSKSTFDLIEDQLKFWRGQVNNTYNRSDAVARIKEIENHLMRINEKALPERIKALEDAYAEIILMGREDK